MKLPNEIINIIFLHSNCYDIIAWRDIVCPIVYAKKCDINIYEACRNGNLIGVKYFFEYHYDKDITRIGGYAMKCAIQYGHLDVVKFLVEKGFKIHPRSLEWIILIEILEIRDYLNSL